MPQLAQCHRHRSQVAALHADVLQQLAQAFDAGEFFVVGEAEVVA